MKKLYAILLFLGFSLWVSAQTTSPTGTSTEVGITEGQLSVSLSGGANYSIPIAVPPGINGVVPQVGLTYNSQGGNGMAGYGWNISGVSAITRIPRTKFHNGVVGGVNLDANDRFALDGQRLILKSGTSYGGAGTIYETESFSNIKITFYKEITQIGNDFNFQFTDYFVVEYPDGSKAYYGNSSDSHSLTDWAITYWENPQGVRISYSYNNTNNSLSIASIKYGSISGSNPINEIKFVYKPRIRPEQAYVSGASILRNTILSEIQVRGNEIGFRNYSLEHNDNVFLGYQTLKSITEKSGDGTKTYNPTNFTYGISENTISSSSSISSGLTNVTSNNTSTISGDFDGDGLMDFIAYPIIGNDAKKKFWLYNNINNNYGFIYPIEKLSGSFDDIFSSTWLDSNNKMGDRQGITAIQRIPYTYEIDFNTYVANNYGGVGVMYSKPVLFPTTLVSSYGFYGNVVLAKKYLSGDFNGDGLTDIIAIDKRDDSAGYTNKVFFIDLDSRKTTNFWNQAGVLSNNFLDSDRIEASDINGDGKTDILHFTNGNLKVYTLNDSNQLTLLWSSSDTDIVTNQSILLGDYNGDGKMDFIIPKSTGSTSYDYFKFLSTGTGLVKSNQTYSFPNEGSGETSGSTGGAYSNFLIPMDVNGDGKTDIIRSKSLYGNSYGGGNIKITIYDNDNNNFTNTTPPYDTQLSSDIIKFPIPIFLSPNTNNHYFEIAEITGTKLFTFTSKKDFSKERLLNTITTGNGVKETITYKPLDSNSEEDYNSIYTAKGYTENYPNTDIIVAPNFKVVTKLEKQSATVYKKQLFSYAGATSNTEGLGFLGFRASMRTNWFNDEDQIISSISKFDPNMRGANTENYTYLGYVSPDITLYSPAANTPRTSAITINDTRTGPDTVQATNSIRFLPGATISPTGTNTFVAQITPDYDANGFAQTNTTPPSNLISKSLSFYEASLSASKVYYLKNTQSNTYNILENTSSETVTEYDAYNNPTESISKVRNAGVGEQTSISSIAYATPSTTPYVIGRPTSKTQSVSVPGDTTTSEELYAYTNSLLTQVKKKGNNTNYITEDNIYDAFGNITKKTITATGLPARETNYEYNPVSPYNGRFLTKSIDVETLATTFIYNPNNGLLDSETNPYNLTTSYLYDSWFKKIKTTDYLNKSNTYAYSRKDNVNSLVTTTGDDGSYSEEVFDDLGRKITSGAKDITGATSKVSYEYDIYDRNTKASEPYIGTGASQWNETKYDEYGRTKQNISFTGKTVAVTYSGLTTTVNDGSKTKTSVKNALGNVVSMTDSPGGTINYTYFASGNLKTTNFDGTVTTIEQDGWGRKTKLTDPSAGTYTYAYNDFGETTSETTPNGTTTYTLNGVGKLIAKSITSTNGNTNSSTVYAYNSSKLLESSTFTNTLEAGAVTTTSFTYDNYKRLVSTTEATPYATFTKTINLFDAFGRVETETTSGTANGKTSSKPIKNTYKNGYAWQILDNVDQKVLWETKTVNARGQLLTASLGNGIAITNLYDQYGFVQEFKHDRTGASTTNVMTLGTVFDEKKGNLSSRTNNLFGTSDTFTYDSLDRLKTYPDPSGVAGAIITQNYHDDGRIKDNTIGTYNYANTAKKYQNTSVSLTPEALTYYQNRGIVAIPSPTALRALTITYNTFKSPVEIAEDGVDKISFVYNDNNDRSAMFYGSLDANKIARPNHKYYSADGSMEIKITPTSTEFVTYIGGDGYSAPIVLKSDDTTQNYLYLHRDYQGSILAITDANANVLEKRLFDAWGAILQVQDGSGNTLNVLTILDRGYTGHEHLQSVALIHMNGRIYDPKLHRFLQPDNYVQDPSNTQSYNRYGYCWNNPLKYADYSGELFGWDDLGVALIGGLINWGTHGFQFNAAGAAYFGTGMAAGVATYYGGPMAGAAVLGLGNSLTDQVSQNGWDNINGGKLLGDTVMSVGMAAIGGQLTQGISPYIDKSVGEVVKNSILKETLSQAVTSSVGGFVMGTMVAGASGSSFKNAIDSGLSGAKIGFATGAITGLQQGYKNYKTVKANTVSNPDNAIKSQAKPTNAFSGDSYDLSKDMPSNVFKTAPVGFSTSSTSVAPSRNYTIYDAEGNLYKFGVSDANFNRMNQSLKMAGQGATAKYSEIVPKFQAHMNETYMRSLHYNSTGTWKINGMIYPYPRNFDTGLKISKP